MSSQPTHAPTRLHPNLTDQGKGGERLRLSDLFCSFESAEAHRGHGYPLSTRDEVGHGDAFVDSVRLLDVARAETDRRDPGFDDQRRSVMPVVESAQSGWTVEVVLGSEKCLDDRAIRGHLGGWCRSHGSASAARGIHSTNSAIPRKPQSVSSARSNT